MKLTIVRVIPSLYRYRGKYNRYSYYASYYMYLFAFGIQSVQTAMWHVL